MNTAAPLRFPNIFEVIIHFTLRKDEQQAVTDQGGNRYMNIPTSSQFQALGPYEAIDAADDRLTPIVDAMKAKIGSNTMK